MDNEMFCSVCHKPYKPYTYEVCERKSTILVPDCECEEKALKQAEEEEKERARVRRMDALNLPPIFARYRLKDLTCEHSGDAQIYVEGFKPHKSKGLFIYGPNGNGKTTLAAVICKELAYRGYNVKFTTMTEMLDKMEFGIGSNRALQAQRVLKELLTYDFVMFDDYGREHYSALRLQNVFQIVDLLYKYQITFGVTLNPECLVRLEKISELSAIDDRMRQVLMRWEFVKPSLRGPVK